MLVRPAGTALATLPPMPQARPSAADMHRLRDLIEAAERPLLLLGGSRWSNTVRKAVHDFALRFDLPVATAWRRLELFDNDHPTRSEERRVGKECVSTCRTGGS